MRTPRDFLGQAYSTSKKNRGASDIDEATEGLATVQGALDRLYTVAARINPEYFGEILAVTLSNGRWTLPARSERVFRLEDPATGNEVIPVSFDDRTLYAGRQATVYFLGRSYRPTGNPGDIVAGDLNFFYAKGAPVVTIDQELTEDIWPAQHDKLLVYECAVYLGLKDSRIAEDLPDLKRERNNRARLFVAHIDHVNGSAVRRSHATAHISDSVIQSALSLLAGGEDAAPTA